MWLTLLQPLTVHYLYGSSIRHGRHYYHTLQFTISLSLRKPNLLAVVFDMVEEWLTLLPSLMVHYLYDKETQFTGSSSRRGRGMPPSWRRSAPRLDCGRVDIAQSAATRCTRADTAAAPPP